MDGVQTAAAGSSSPGLLESLKHYLLGWVDLLKTRVEIISTELEEEKVRLTDLIVTGLAAFVCCAFGVAVLTGFVVALLWDYRLWVLGGFTALYLGFGFWLAALTKKKLQTRPKLFSTTLAELAKDREHLSK
jgi:uncharacterized membrane protein YqjE